MTTSYVTGPVRRDSEPVSERSRERNRTSQRLQEFLTATSASPQTGKLCPRCGQIMQYVGATLSLYGGDTEWKIQLPVCPCSMAALGEGRKGDSRLENVFSDDADPWSTIPQA